MALGRSLYFSLLARRWRNGGPLRFHQGFQQGHGFREGVSTAPVAACAAGGVEGRAAAGVFSGQVGAMGDEEFDELIETMFGRTVQNGLVRHSVRARHLTPATVSLGDPHRGAVFGGSSESLHGLGRSCNGSAAASRSTASPRSGSAWTTGSSTRCATAAPTAGEAAVQEGSGVHIRAGFDQQ